VKGENAMNVSENNVFEDYKAEVVEKWGKTDAFREYSEKTRNYSKDKQNGLIKEMSDIFADFASCMKTERHDSAKAQSLVEKLQSHITENYYTCTTEILSGLGKMYVCDERFKYNIDKHGEGTAQFVSDAVGFFTNSNI